MSAPLEKTKHPGIYRAGVDDVGNFRNAAGKQCCRSASSTSLSIVRFDVRASAATSVPVMNC
jgi:hypothetical protein